MASPTTESAPPSPPDSGDLMSKSPPENRNARLFILFRIFFSCRFYYPVFAILFVNFGLSVEQFAYLNLAWAITIVVLEVPSGALADQFGRRILLIAASVLMLAEMLILCLSPVVELSNLVNDPAAHKQAVSFLFVIFLFNRIISGAAEAAASGADEALAYDSLSTKNRGRQWSQITLQLMRWQAFSFILVSLIGAAVYDPKFINWLTSLFGFSTRFSQSQTLKFPIFLNLLMAIVTLGISLRMKENHQPGAKNLPLLLAINNSIQKTYSTGMQILRHPATFMLILIGLFFDSIIRLYYTVSSFYLHLLAYEPRHFGPISMAGSLTGIAAAWIAGRLIHRFSPSTNFYIVTLLIFLGLFSLAFPIPYISVVFLIPLWLAMRLLHFFISNYLNQITASENRATVLSFKSMNMNLAYGSLVFLYGLQSKYLHSQIDSPLFSNDPEALEKNVFAQAVSTWWLYFALVVGGIFLFQKIKYGRSLDEMMLSEEHKLKESR